MCSRFHPQETRHDEFSCSSRLHGLDRSLGKRRRPDPAPETQSRDDLRAELKRYGITPVQLTVFDWGGYRYTNSKDAIAAAKRLAAS
jgi:hypothetical protein